MRNKRSDNFVSRVAPRPQLEDFFAHIAEEEKARLARQAAKFVELYRPERWVTGV